MVSGPEYQVRKRNARSTAKVGTQNIQSRPEDEEFSDTDELESDGSSYEEDNYSDSSFDEPIHAAADNMHLNTFSYYLNKTLLFLPTATAIIIRSLGDHDFRAVAIAWAVLVPFTSDISMDEAVFPALLASSLGFDNNVVQRNMYISIARSRLGLFALMLLSVYTSDYHILGCGILLRILDILGTHVLQRSISISEITLISGACVNIIYHCIADAFYDNISDPVSLILSGLGAALPCYPLFIRFMACYRKYRGNFRQWPWACAIYALYFSSAIYLYFYVFGVNFSDLWRQVLENADIVAYWACVLTNAFCIATFYGEKLELDGRRKLWHICTVLMFLPNWIRQRTFTKLALAVALVLFIALETARATVLPPFGQAIHNALQEFVDHRDKRGPVVISHLYLLLGISVPIFLAESPAGLVCLGLGDTFASQIGRRFGRLRIFGHKSLEGTVAFAVVAALALSISTEASFTSHKTWIVAFLTALLEAVTPINDNLIVPVYMLSLQGLLSEKPGNVRTWGF